MPDDTPILRAHIEDTVQAIAKHADHHSSAGALQHMAERLTAWIGRPASEETRRDNPHLRKRVDEEAEAMVVAADPPGGPGRDQRNRRPAGRRRAACVRRRSGARDRFRAGRGKRDRPAASCGRPSAQPGVWTLNLAEAFSMDWTVHEPAGERARADIPVSSTLREWSGNLLERTDRDSGTCGLMTDLAAT